MWKKPNFSLPIHDGRAFTWYRKTAVVDRSDLRGLRSTDHRWIDGRVWKDSADVGFLIKSHRTGATKLFIFDRKIENDDDIVAWTFKSEDGIVVTVFNDQRLIPTV